MSIIKTHNIFINSELRNSGTNTDFIINLKEPLRLLNNHNYFRVKVGRTIIPNVINQINASNNILSYNISRPSVPLNSSGNITLSIGNYNILTLLTELSSKLTANIALLGVSIKTNFTYDRTTGKTTLGLTGLDAIATTITLYFNSNLKLGAFFGFTSNAVFSYTNTTTSTNITGNNYVNVNPINHIYLRSALPQRESYENIIEDTTITDILAKIPLMGYTSGQYIFYDNSVSYCDLSIKIIDSINLYLSDNLSYYIDLSLNWTTVLIIEEIGSDKSDYILEMEIMKQNNEDQALLQEIQLLKTLVKEKQLSKMNKIKNKESKKSLTE